ncbi:MAG: hypothetical protein PHC88_05515 [Terrimicrobiaceae bacterium]|nr:hypothetical protein [Terrimicrobiaceae bacterium]
MPQAPWEKYQNAAPAVEAGPWTKYAAPSSEISPELLASRQAASKAAFEANLPPETGIIAGVKRGFQNLNPINLVRAVAENPDEPNSQMQPADVPASNAQFEQGLQHLSDHPVGTMLRQVPIMGQWLADMAERFPNDPAGTAAEAVTTLAVPEAIVKGAPHLANQASRLAPALEKSAQGNYKRILNPTKEKTKFITNKIIPELTKRGVSAWTETEFRAKIAASKTAAGKAVDAAWEKIPAGEKLPAQPLVEAIERLKNEFTSENVEILPAAVEKLSELKGMVEQFGDQISAGSMRKVRQLLDQVVDESSGFGGKDLKATSQVAAQKQVATLFRRHIGEAYPDVKAANAEFTFWSNVDDVMNAKSLRETGRNLSMKDLISGATGAGIGAAKGGVLGGPIGAVVGPLLVRFMQSTAWRTTSAAVKMEIADLISKGKFAEVVKIIGPERQLPEHAGGPYAMGDGSGFVPSAGANQLNVTTGTALMKEGYPQGTPGQGSVVGKGSSNAGALLNPQPPEIRSFADYFTGKQSLRVTDLGNGTRRKSPKK